MRALHDMMNGDEKKKRAKTLVWTEEGTVAFYQIAFQKLKTLGTIQLVEPKR
jgi:hypothetical protein